MRTGEESIDHPLKGVWVAVSEKGLGLGKRRGKSGQVVGRPTKERPPIGLYPVGQPRRLQPGKQESVDGIGGLTSDYRDGRITNRLKGPEAAVFRSDRIDGLARPRLWHDREGEKRQTAEQHDDLHLT